MREFLLVLMVLCATPCASAQQTVRPTGFVNAADAIPGLMVEMRYAGSDNFVGRPIAGYDAPICYLTARAATALAAAQQELSAFGLGLKVFDCYRPTRAVATFVTWARDISDQARKAEFYPNVDKTQLFALDYIGERSGHSRGSTVDLTLIDMSSGRELDMGTPFDFFDVTSWPTEASMTSAQRANRLLLQSIMRVHGFRHYAKEWWHFTLRDEPYPRDYFDFPVARAAPR